MRTQALALALLCMSCAPAHALTITAANVEPTPAGAAFDVTFSSAPKLSAEEDGPAFMFDEFQFEISGEGSRAPVVVRGGEIPCAGAIPVRAIAPPDPSQCAGGWGVELDAVPYTLAGSRVRFVVPWASMGGDGPFPFSYHLTVTHAGAITDERHGQSAGLLIAPAVAARVSSWGRVKARYVH